MQWIKLKVSFKVHGDVSAGEVIRATNLALHHTRNEAGFDFQDENSFVEEILVEKKVDMDELYSLYYDIRDAVKSNLPDEPDEDVEEFYELISNDLHEVWELRDAIAFLSRMLGNNFPDMADAEEQEEMNKLLSRAKDVAEYR